MNTFALQRLAPIRNRLSEQVSTLQAIEGAAEHAATVRQAPARTPTAYVVLSGAESQSPGGASGVVIQDSRVEVSVVLAVRNYRVHELGAEVTDQLETLIRDVQDALIGWSPDGEHALYHVRGALMSYDESHLFWREDFARRARIRKGLKQ